MKKFLMLLILLFPLTTTGCVTTKKTNKLVLPPKPQREIMPEVESMKDVSKLINYYEHLVQAWEQWSDDVSIAVEALNIE